MGGKPDHDYHILEPSPWPLLASFMALFTFLGLVLFMHDYPAGSYMMIASMVALVLTAAYWWRDVIKEARVDKAHTSVVQKGLRWGMLLFIISEVMFFVAFFWSVFKAWLDPVFVLDGYWPTVSVGWPPAGIELIPAWGIPFLNTLILLLSGCAVTWAHHAMLEGDRKGLVDGLKYTIILGLIFTGFQIYEYDHATYALDEGIYPSNFYLATGFHGFHVAVGTIFLIVCYFRAKKGHFDKGENHLGFEFAAWYWHFVDVVWLFLFSFLYWLSVV